MLSYLYDFARDTVSAVFRTLFAPPVPMIRKKERIPKALRDNVWRKYIGDNFLGQCYTCGCDIDYTKGWHCSHVIAESKGGSTTIGNLRPCCRHCNLSMGTMNLYLYIHDRGLTGPGKTHMTRS